MHYKQINNLCAPPPAHSTHTAAVDRGWSCSQNPFCGGGGPLPVMEFPLPVHTDRRVTHGVASVSSSSVVVLGSLPVRPPVSLGSADERHTAVMSEVAERGGAFAAGCLSG